MMTLWTNNRSNPNSARKVILGAKKERVFHNPGDNSFLAARAFGREIDGK